MTDNDDPTTTSKNRPGPDPSPASSDAAGDSGASAPNNGATRTRTRTRSAARSDAAVRGRSSAASQRSRRGGDEESSDAPNSDTGASKAQDGDNSGDQGTKRRRRRGGRGRGGKQGGAAAAKNAGDGGNDEHRDANDANDDNDGNGGDDVASEIERGGTRMAAKRGRGSGSGGNRRGAVRVGGVAEDVRRAMLDGPPRTMLVTQLPDRTQIAVLEERTVVEHFVTRKEDVTFVGNIYMGRVQNVLPGMEAAFLDIGKGRNGVLYAGEVLYDELDLEEGADQRIENVLKPGQTVPVQVTKDPMGTKGPRLTMHLSLAGRYLVLAPNSDLFGISRKLTDKERDRLRKIVKQAKPDDHGIIVRTAAEDATAEQLTADLQRLLAKWERVAQAAEEAKALEVVYEEPPLVVKVIRDTFGAGFERCVVDDEALYLQVRNYLEEVAPELLSKLALYGQPTRTPAADQADDGDKSQDGDDQEPSEQVDVQPVAGDPPIPAPLTVEELAEAAKSREELGSLFDAYDVSEQLRRAMARKVWLPSGGYLIIEATEAMKVIDVNTGKFTGDSDTNLEEVVLKTNLEAAEEIVHQLRLRDLGGIVVIDFIDMLLKANQDQVVRRLKRELLRDRTKTRVSEVSRLGLVQMTRKNVSQGLIESFSHTCEHCDGRGIISELD